MKKYFTGLLIQLLCITVTLPCATADIYAAESDLDAASGSVIALSDIEDEQDSENAILQTITVEIPEEHFTEAADSSDTDNDELFAEYVNNLFGNTSSASGSTSAPRKARRVTRGSKLTGQTKDAYYFLADEIVKIASSERSDASIVIPLSVFGIEKSEYTAEELGVERDQEAMIDALRNKLQVSLNDLIIALLADFPYEMYWYNKVDKTSATSPGISITSVDGICNSIRFNSDYTIYFPVAQAYALDTYKTDVSKTGAATNAVKNAKKVVSDYSGKNSYEKLVAYKGYICDAVTYNKNAANNSDTPYGDPWQLIYVFDNDASTNVVCEGYSKAFQYLCDQSDFKGEVVCNSMTGTMTGGTGAGRHMWNVVSLNGENYLADITNSDTDTVGQNGELFLAGYDGDSTQQYTIACRSKNITYLYDDDTLEQYSAEERSLAKTSFQAEGYQDPEDTKTSELSADATTINNNANNSANTSASQDISKQETAKEEAAGHKTLEATDKAVTSMKSDSDPSNSVFGVLSARVTSTKKTSLKIQWNKVSGAAGYVIYANKCGKSNRYVKIADLSGGAKKSYNLTKIKGKKLKKNTYYKILVMAYQNSSTGKRVIATAKTIHAATAGGKNGNPAKLTVNKTKVTVKKGKKFTLKARQTAKSGVKIKKHRVISYESSNPAIATVSKKGLIQGKKKGTCTIYVYAQNGLFKKVKATVK